MSKNQEILEMLEKCNGDENAAQVKVLKGANEQLETVVGTLINSIPNFSEITGKGGLIDIEA